MWEHNLPGLGVQGWQHAGGAAAGLAHPGGRGLGGGGQLTGRHRGRLHLGLDAGDPRHAVAAPILTVGLKWI